MGDAPGASHTLQAQATTGVSAQVGTPLPGAWLKISIIPAIAGS